jgi:hypothetical protein
MHLVLQISHAEYLVCPGAGCRDVFLVFLRDVDFSFYL